jgi:hypothetical protein
MIPSDWLVRCVMASGSSDTSTTDRQSALDDLAKKLGGRRTDWMQLSEKIQLGDELWEFDSPIEYWDSLSGSSGVALVRDGCVVAEVTIDMN